VTVLRALVLTMGLILVSAVGVVIQCTLFWLDLPAARTFPMRYHRTVCRLIGLRINLHGAIAEARPLLLVSNHVSWLDITVIGSLVPLSFVAKQEVASWPVFGLFARLQRSVFIDRNRRRGAHAANAALAERLKAGEVMVLFAEGTSSDGNRVLPFKSAILGAAEQAVRESHLPEVAIQPMAIAYTHRHGLPIDRLERPFYAWYGNMDLLPHIWGVLKHGPVDVSIALGPVHATADFADRKQLSRALESEVRRMFTAEVYGTPPAPRTPTKARGKEDLPTAYRAGQA
jgi:1-acyl-sn-glycerol-3-phosphate acyltransferase